MTNGIIVKLVRSYGSRWGRIQPIGTSREVFFNQASLPEGADFDGLRDGQVVQFDEEPDRANGTHAVRIVCVDLPVIAKATSWSVAEDSMDELLG
jgi:cold shock CspA family protein